jgi:hypothetical protein
MREHARAEIAAIKVAAPNTALKDHRPGDSGPRWRRGVSGPGPDATPAGELLDGKRSNMLGSDAQAANNVSHTHRRAA